MRAKMKRLIAALIVGATIVLVTMAVIRHVNHKQHVAWCYDHGYANYATEDGFCVGARGKLIKVGLYCLTHAPTKPKPRGPQLRRKMPRAPKSHARSATPKTPTTRGSRPRGLEGPRRRISESKHCRQTQNCHCEKYLRVGRHPCQKLDHPPA